MSKPIDTYEWAPKGSDLDPCASCGGPGEVRYRRGRYFKPQPYGNDCPAICAYAVACVRCQRRTRDFRSRWRAVVAWNRGQAVEEKGDE